MLFRHRDGWIHRKALALGVSAVLVIAIILSVVYFETRDTYAIIGTLHYRPGSAIYPGISAANITPTVSPEPSNITVTNRFGQTSSVASFVYLNFPKTSTLGVNFRPNPPFFSNLVRRSKRYGFRENEL